MLFNNNGYGITNSEENISMEAMAHIVGAIMMEGLSDDELSAFLENQTEVDAALSDNVLLEKTIVRLDKKAKLSKAHKMAIFTLAKEKKDPKFKKLLTVWKMERNLEAYLTKKYGNEALRRAKKAVATSAKSKSSMVKTAANNVKKQLNDSSIKN